MRRRLLAVGAIACIAVAAAPVAVVHAQTTTPRPLPPTATIVLPGHGWGHGRGMGQWGANGMARSGGAYRNILTHYYSGVAFAARPTNETLRVLVESSPDVLVTSEQPFAVRWSNGTRIGVSDATFKFWRARYDGSNYIVERSTAWNGSWSQVGTSTNYAVFSPGNAMLQVVFGSGTVRIYRGTIIARYSSAYGMRSINELPLDWYLYGSVPRESPASWPAEELKAQAVAARTYAVYKKESARANGTMFDICATTSCQVYMGYGSRTSVDGSTKTLESKSASDAVDATTGQILTYNGKPILAEYSSSTGGYSAAGSVAYQKAVPDTADSVSPHHVWTGVVRVSEVESHWPELGHLVDINVTARNGYGEWGGRVSQMQLVGTNSTVTVSGGGFSSAFGWPSRSNGLKGSWFDPRYWKAELVSAPTDISMLAGGTITVPVQIRNTGNQTWPVGGTVRLTAAAGSPFASERWVSPTRPASVSRNVTDPSRVSVGRGQVAEFRVLLSATGLAPGTYSQRFGSSADGASIMSPAFTLAVQVLPSWTEEVPNMIANPSFEYGVGGWTVKNFTRGDGVATPDPRDGSQSLHLGAGTKYVTQTIPLAGGGARRFTLGGWNRSSGTNASGGVIELDARTTYADGTSELARVAFSRGAHAWSYAETAFVTSPSKKAVSLTLIAQVANQTGDTWFDASRLIESPVGNGSFENGMTGWGASGFADGDGIVTSTARDGAHALALAAATPEGISQVIPLTGRRSERFVASVWSRAEGTSEAGGAQQLSIAFTTTSGATSVQSVDLPTAPHPWTLTEASIVAPADFTGASVSVTRASQSGTLYVDDVRIVRTWTQNPSFDAGALAPWTAIGSNVTLGLPARDGAAAARLTGSGTRAVSQRVTLRGGAGKRLVLAGWSRAIGTNPTAGFIGVRVVFRNTDGTLSPAVVPFSRTSHQWAYLEQAVTASKAFNGVDVVAMMVDQSGSVGFDGLILRSL